MRPLALACFVCIAGLALWAVDGQTIERQPYGYDGERVTDPVPLGAWDELAPVGAGWRPVYQFLWHDPLDGHGPTKVSGLWPIGLGSRTERRPYGPGVTSLTERQGREHEGLDGFARGGMRVVEGEDWLWNQWVFAERVRSWTARAEDGRVLLLSGPYEVMGNSIVLEFQLVRDGEAHALDESRGWRLLSMSVFDRGEHTGVPYWKEAGGLRARFGVDGDRVQVRFARFDESLGSSIEGRLTFQLPPEATGTELTRMRALGKAMGRHEVDPGPPTYGIEEGRVRDPIPAGYLARWDGERSTLLQTVEGWSTTLIDETGLHPIPRGILRDDLAVLEGRDWVLRSDVVYPAEPGEVLRAADGRLILRSAAHGEWYSRTTLEVVLEPTAEGMVATQLHTYLAGDVGSWWNDVDTGHLLWGRDGDRIQIRFQAQDREYGHDFEGRLTFDLSTARPDVQRFEELDRLPVGGQILATWRAEGFESSMIETTKRVLFVVDDGVEEELPEFWPRLEDGTGVDALEHTAAFRVPRKKSIRLVHPDVGTAYRESLEPDFEVRSRVRVTSGRLGIRDQDGDLVEGYLVEPGTYAVRLLGFSLERGAPGHGFLVVELLPDDV